MLMLPGVLVALLSANAASERAWLDHCAENLLVGARPPQRERTGCDAYVCAVEVEPNALPQLCNSLFRNASVGA
jgi:hypothetical protein